MDKFAIRGGNRLHGTISVSGSKNSSLPILAATLLTRERCVLHRVPDLTDVRYMLDILRYLGADVEFSQGSVVVEARKVVGETPYDLVRRMRASVCVLGPLLARCGRAKVSLPGGCVIGDRPIDLHLRGLEALGSRIALSKGYVIAEASGLVGARMSLQGPHGSTVLGTDNVMMAACLARGTTIVENAASEPEVADLARFLCSMGAKVRRAGGSRLEIEGVDELHGAEHTVISDRIEAGTFAVAAAITRSELVLEEAPIEHMRSTLSALQDAGVFVEAAEGRLRVRATDPLHPLQLRTGTYPGFPTDMQAQFCALAATIPGRSRIEDDIFPNRFMHISELKRMGAHADLLANVAVIDGVDRLSGAPVMASDLRASAALVLAGLQAENTTTISRVYHIDRGYERIDAKLRAVGADIERLPK
ncbi:UDP-N-acetylglucosamine 1-carboxyvinyltransferase [Methylacidimicrobium cyclopophantes]|uniref:UDP-N-acetylglucosamine 1-carboxyvinyltransferase n=1 Tax=Methylacidimicrobium cyclopophantes TaxID=1041766 RepID=A0A5E6M508_9BACT|nr:UDP-N-acetylglucosamine 1-carboxyvinyltransferase [Methylacidimicrobium cyclopophantes]VVM04431.1 UDP-N-acetylglucosamine 1-carboxyvinyltransferase [Methylacidimicrobium cyclopophantes]